MDVDSSAMESGKRIFQTDSELTNNSRGSLEFLWVFIKGEMVDLKASTKIPNVPIPPIVF
jgi:hypothetical protein